MRLIVPGRLDDVEFVEPTLVDLRMQMTTPMQHGRVFVAGDAAHVITPAGGKGMNLAIQDAVELAHGLIERFGPAPTAIGWPPTPTPACRHLANAGVLAWMLRLILAGSDESAGEADAARFGAGLRQGWVSALQHDPILARWFAHAYAGVDPDWRGAAHWRRRLRRGVDGVDEGPVAGALPAGDDVVHHVTERDAGIGVGEAERAAGAEVAEAARVRAERAVRPRRLEAEPEGDLLAEDRAVARPTGRGWLRPTGRATAADRARAGRRRSGRRPTPMPWPLVDGICARAPLPAC